MPKYIIPVMLIMTNYNYIWNTDRYLAKIEEERNKRRIDRKRIEVMLAQ